MKSSTVNRSAFLFLFLVIFRLFDFTSIDIVANAAATIGGAYGTRQLSKMMMRRA